MTRIVDHAGYFLILAAVSWPRDKGFGACHRDAYPHRQVLRALAGAMVSKNGAQSQIISGKTEPILVAQQSPHKARRNERRAQNSNYCGFQRRARVLPKLSRTRAGRTHSKFQILVNAESTSNRANLICILLVFEHEFENYCQEQVQEPSSARGHCNAFY